MLGGGKLGFRVALALNFCLSFLQGGRHCSLTYWSVKGGGGVLEEGSLIEKGV